MAVREQLIELLEPAVERLGYDLVDLEFNQGGRSGTLRLFIDAEGGITLADCEHVSKRIGALLDVEDPIESSYVLEISSPGLDRALRTREHYERFTGRRVRVQLKTGLAGRRRFTGVLQGIDDADQVVLRLEEAELVRLPLADVRKARLAPEWS